MATLTEHESLLLGVEMLWDELKPHFSEIQRISSDQRYTAEHKAELLEAAVKEARGTIAKRLGSERQDVEVTRKQAQQALADARYVDPQLQAARAQVLAPIINKAADDSDALIDAYARRFGNLVDRILLQETAEAMIDAGVGKMDFAEKWSAMQERLPLPEVEQEALAKIQSAHEAHDYLNAVEGVADLELRQAVGAPIEGVEYMRASRLTSRIYRYENTGTTQIDGASGPLQAVIA